MDFNDVITEVGIKIQDLSEEILVNIPSWINEVVSYVGSECEVPDLKKLGTLTTTVEAYASAPPDFNRKLLAAGYNGSAIRIHPGGLLHLFNENPGLDEIGDVHTIVVEGTMFYYQGIPSTVATLPILYISKPAVLSESSPTIPEWIPDFLRFDLLVNGVSARAFEIIEDGIDGEKINMISTNTMFERGIIRFREHLARHRKSYCSSVWRI